MMSGIVSRRQAVLPVSFRYGGRTLSVDFVVDTGFTGELTLPVSAVTALGLRFKQQTPTSLADDSSLLLDVHEAVILWNGEERRVEVIATGKRPLLGTALLEDTELVMQFREGGLVTVGGI